MKKQAGIDRAYTIEEFSRKMIQLYGKPIVEEARENK